MKAFDAWNKVKKSIDSYVEESRPFFSAGEIWWSRLGVNVGYETDGKNGTFQRPVIILKKYNQYSFLALPLTSSPKRNPYRLPIGKVGDKEASATLS